MTSKNGMFAEIFKQERNFDISLLI